MWVDLQSSTLEYAEVEGVWMGTQSQTKSPNLILILSGPQKYYGDVLQTICHGNHCECTRADGRIEGWHMYIMLFSSGSSVIFPHVACASGGRL